MTTIRQKERANDESDGLIIASTIGAVNASPHLMRRPGLIWGGRQIPEEAPKVGKRARIVSNGVDIGQGVCSTPLMATGRGRRPIAIRLQGGGRSGTMGRRVKMMEVKCRPLQHLHVRRSARRDPGTGGSKWPSQGARDPGAGSGAPTWQESWPGGLLTACGRLAEADRRLSGNLPAAPRNTSLRQTRAVETPPDWGSQSATRDMGLACAGDCCRIADSASLALRRLRRR